MINKSFRFFSKCFFLMIIMIIADFRLSIRFQKNEKVDIKNIEIIVESDEKKI